jgi:cation diffusion facilitator family transporter
MSAPSLPAADAPHAAERRTRAVVALTAVTMVVEIVAGWWFNSMALLADGWHMGTHAAAIGLTALAYAATRKLKHDPRFAFGPWKIEVLAAFASAVALLAVAVGMVGASVERLVSPQPIAYREAIAVAVAGLVVNLVCAWILGPHGHGPGEAHAEGHGHHHHGHGHDHGHAHAHAHHSAHDAARTVHTDLNLRSAYLHVIADAATSALAIAALAGGLWLGWAWLDPVIGVVGAAMVARWGVGLVRDSSRVLLDREMDLPRIQALREAFEQQPPWHGRATLRRLQVWRVGPGRFACTIALALHDSALGMKQVRQTLAGWPEIVDSTVQLEMAAPPLSSPRS